MTNSEIIANRILEVLQGNKRKPFFIRFTHKVGEVVLDFSNDVSAMAVNFIDTENRSRNERDTYRLLYRLKKGLRDLDLRKILDIVMKKFVYEIKNSKLDHLEQSLEKATGKFVVNTALINDLASIFTEKFIGRMAMGLIISTIFSIGGSVSRAIYTSERLRVVNNDLYNQLRVAGDLDLFYFMVDAYATPFLDAMALKNTNPDAWNEVLVILSNNLQP